MKEKLLTIMFTLFCLTAAGQENQNNSTLVGDANGDGKVDVADIVEVENYIKGNQSVNFVFTNADVSNDNTINNQDVDGIMGIIMTSPNQHYYSFLSLEDTSKWDGILISTRGFLAAFKNYEGIRSYLISSLEDKNLSKAIVAYFNSDDNLVSIVVDNVCLHFIEDLEGNNYISYIENGKPILIKSEALSRLNIARSRSLISTEYGINTNTTFHDLNRLVSAVDILSGIGELTSFLPSLEGVLFDKILDLNSSKDIPTDAKIVLSIVNSLAGVGVTVMATALIIGISAEALVPMAIISTLNLITNIGAQYEDHLNEEKKILFFLEAGLTEIETLYPINLGNNKFKLGVRVSKTESLPETGKYNTFGLLLEKEGDGVEAVNLYSKGTNICMEENLICDGDFYIEVPNIEPGYKYFCRAFIMTPSEKAKREKNKIGHYNSYAFYGNIEEFKSDGPKRELEYEQISAENLSGDKVKFKAKVNVDIIDFSDNIEKWGVRLYKDDVKYELSDYIEKIYLRSGSSTYNPSYNPGYWSGEIEFEASSESLSINKNLHQAKTIDHWKIGTYVLYNNGTDKRESLYLEPFDLVYSKIPEAKTLEMSTPTKVTSATVECEFSNFGLWEGECGVEYWKEGGQHLEKYIEANQSGKYSIELTGLSPFTSYKYRAFVKVNDSYYRAQETKDFVTQYCKPKYKGCEIIEKCYDYKNYHYKDKTYSYKFHIATSWEIETLDNIVDWGYKYIDLENKPEPISLMMFGKSYKDSRYAYYRNDRETEIKLLPYSKHGKSSAGSRRSVTRNSDGDEDGYVYGDTITIKLIYDHQPVATTFEPLSIAETMATVKCEFKDAAPWEGICGVEYWSDDNHLQKTIVNNADGEVEIELTNLLPNTTYQYRAFIKVGNEYFWAKETKSFQTQILPIITVSVSDISYTGANLLANSNVKSAYSGFRVKKAEDENYIEYFAEMDDEGNFNISLDHPESLDQLSIGTEYQYYAFIVERGEEITSEIKTFTTNHICPDENHPHLIDLGLGVKWACCNVEASKPYEYGGYYAWGEVNQRPITSYYDENYAYYNEINGGNIYIGDDISGTIYDTALFNWGDTWKMPTVQDFKELCEYCPSRSADINGINGHIFISSYNGKAIFLPAAGSTVGNKWEGSFIQAENNGGEYWSSTYCTEEAGWTEFAYTLSFLWATPDTGGKSNTSFSCRFCALPIRAVKAK